MHVLVTGGAGYIGSTIVSALEDSGYSPVILDSLVTGNKDFLRHFPAFIGDIADKLLLQEIKQKYPTLKSVIHCAARVIVPESVEQPLLYYRENVSKTISLLENCLELGIDRFVFSSSASVYGEIQEDICDEYSPIAPQTPYSQSKYFAEQINESTCRTANLKALSLRYFNPIGADPKLRAGPFLKEPTHLLGVLTSYLSKPARSFHIYGKDWKTKDGTPIHDFIHVWDLAKAHVNAVDYLNSPHVQNEYETINLGTGLPTTVLEFVNTFSAVSGVHIPVLYSGRRPGDPKGCAASCQRAVEILKWKAEYSLAEGIRSALRWKELILTKRSLDTSSIEASI